MTLKVEEDNGARLRQIAVQEADGLNRAFVRIQLDKRTGPAKALLLLTRVVLEAVVRARYEQPEPDALDRYAQGSRFNG